MDSDPLWKYWITTSATAHIVSLLFLCFFQIGTNEYYYTELFIC
jgi:hypothetical protein